MAQYTAENIRNIALAGHGSAGKTSLAEALLFKAGATDRLGKVVLRLYGKTIVADGVQRLKAVIQCFIAAF